MQTKQQKKSYPFLQGGGEMGERTRGYDWSQTSLGAPGQWPQALQISLSNILNSGFPMFLFWGDDLVCFYNDAYRPSLGDEGKHPAIGKNGKEVWPEIWDFIGPLIDSVLATGQPVWFENQYLPIYRNGRLEDVYWTFSYSLVVNDNGLPGGVLVTCMETTEKVLAAKKLEESQARFRNMVEQAPVAITLTQGYDMIIESINAPMLRIMNKQSAEEALQKKLTEVLPEVEGQPVQAVVQNVLKTGKAFSGMEVPVQLVTDGVLQTRYFDLSYTPIMEEGKNTAVLHVAIDVTQQVAARHKIEESEAKYRTLFEAMDQGFCIVEMVFDKTGKAEDYRFLEVNPTFEKQTGLQEAVGKTMRQLAPHHEEHWFEIYGKVALTGEPTRFIEQAAALNRWYDVYAFPVGEKEQAKVAILFTDITEQKKAEEAIRQSEQNLRNMILQSPVAMCILKGPSFIVEIANDRMYELWGRGAEALLHRSLFEGLPEASKQGYEELLSSVYTTGQTFSTRSTPVNVPRAGGVETIYIDLLYEAFREPDGTISGVMAVATDVTEQVLARRKIEEMVEQRTKELAQANEALQQTNKELQRSNANLEEFAHAASHDLKEPIRKIQFFTTHLKEQLSSHLNEREVRSFSRIENATERMGHLIDDLLLYSHVSQRPHETEAVDLNETVQRVLEDLELDIEEKKADIRVGTLPVVQGYRRQLQQLFQNLVSNALKYSKTNVPAAIDISAEQAEKNGIHYHLVKITDNGIGFSQEYEDKIFQMFSRLHGRSEYSGTGVGLSIVKKVVENHRGTIKAESVPGQGSTFKVYLPE